MVCLKKYKLKIYNGALDGRLRGILAASPGTSVAPKPMARSGGKFEVSIARIGFLWSLLIGRQAPAAFVPQLTTKKNTRQALELNLAGRVE